MKKREKIMGIKVQSDEPLSREKLWYFSEESVDFDAPIQQEKESRSLDTEKRMAKGMNEHAVIKTIGKNRYKRECSFVVDWQLSDSL